MAEKSNKILIIGASKSSVEMIDLLHKARSVNIVGIADADPDAPGMKLAKELGIPHSTDYKTFLRRRSAHVILNMTGSRRIAKELSLIRRADIEIMGSLCANLIGGLIDSVPAPKEAKYQSIFEAMPSGVAYHSMLSDRSGEPSDYIFIEVNRAFEKLIGLKKGDIIGKKATEVLPGIKSSMFDWVSFYGKVALGGKGIGFEQYLQDLDKWYAVSVFSPRKGYFTTIYDDITKRKKAEESLREAYDTLKKTQAQLVQTEKLEVVGRLASGVAHEVKNPLAILQQGVHYLEKKIQSTDQDISFVLNSMNEAVTRARDIINDILDFSRLSDMQIVPVDLNAVIKSALMLVKSDIKHNNIELIEDAGDDLPKARLDKNRIAQVLINLIMNSIQAMPGGGQLKISTRETEGSRPRTVTLTIEDTGTGIPESVMHKIFDPFFTTKDVGQGTGLGLSIVKSIVESHKGRIEIDNRKDVSGVKVTLKFLV